MWNAAYRCTRIALIAIGVGLLAVPSQAQDPGFIEQVIDLPLMPGLSEVKDAGVVFDKPDGRIVEAYAEGDLKRDAVIGFYSDTLPQLGWQAGPGLSFQREGEQLQIDIREEGAGVTVQYTLSPQ